MENILNISNLSKEYKNFKLDNISFSLPRGYIMGFIGANGAGKTTTIKLIMNLIRKSSGKVEIFGKDNIKHEIDVKSNIGFVYDECNYYEELSIKDNVSIVKRFYKTWNQKQCDEYLRKFNLDSSKKVKELSKGMKMKFAISIALSHGADLIIMDEPTSGLDPVSRSEILEILQEYIQDGEKSVVFSTHITSDLEKVADYITFINRGKLEFSMSKDEILERYKIVKGGLDILNDDFRKKFIKIKKNSFGFEGLTNNAENIRREYVNEVIIEKATLEDIMVYTVGGELNA